MKKLIAVLLALVFVLGCFAACGSKTETDPTNTADTDASLQNVLDAGKLVIATSPDFPPFENLNDDGSVTGIEIDLLTLICEKLGVSLEIQQMDFDSVLNGIPTGKFDLAVSGITADDERKENALFTEPYCLAAQAIVVPEGSAIKTKADLEGKAVSAQTATTAEKFCMASGYQVSSFSANSDAELAAVTGKVDAWVIDDLTAAEMVKAYNTEHDDKLVVLDEPMTTEPYGFATKLGNNALIEKINAILADLLADGTIAKIFADNDAPFTAPTQA